MQDMSLGKYDIVCLYWDRDCFWDDVPRNDIRVGLYIFSFLEKSEI
jgi:hypothetical protein